MKDNVNGIDEIHCETYEYGDKFIYREQNWKYVLAILPGNVGKEMVALVNTKLGSHWGEAVVVKNSLCITAEELNQIRDIHILERLMEETND